MGSGFSGPVIKDNHVFSIIAWEGTCTWIASHWIPENRFGNPLMRRNIGIDLVSMMVQERLRPSMEIASSSWMLTVDARFPSIRWPPSLGGQS